MNQLKQMLQGQWIILFYPSSFFIILGFMQVGVPSNDPVIGQVSDQSAAHKAGLQTSDKIISIDG